MHSDNATSSSVYSCVRLCKLWKMSYALCATRLLYRFAWHISNEVQVCRQGCSHFPLAKVKVITPRKKSKNISKVSYHALRPVGAGLQMAGTLSLVDVNSWMSDELCTGFRGLSFRLDRASICIHFTFHDAWQTDSIMFIYFMHIFLLSDYFFSESTFLHYSWC